MDGRRLQARQQLHIPCAGHQCARSFRRHLHSRDNGYAPAPARDLSASSEGGKVVLNWTQWSNDQTGFVIERSGDGVNFSPLVTVGSNLTTFTDSTVTGSGVYSYRVIAANASNYSAPSNVDTGVSTVRNGDTIEAESHDEQVG